MNDPRDPRHDPRDVDAEFARMLEDEGMVLRPGRAPHEPAAEDDPPGTDSDGRDPDGEAAGDLWSFSADSPDEPPTPESRARSRAAHPSAGAPGGDGPRSGAGSRELDDDEVIYGDFEPPDPDLPEPASGTLWSWFALIGGFVLLMVVTVSDTLPAWLGWLAGACAVGGLVALLLRVPRSRGDDDGDGAEV